MSSQRVGGKTTPQRLPPRVQLPSGGGLRRGCFHCSLLLLWGQRTDPLPAFPLLQGGLGFSITTTQRWPILRTKISVNSFHRHPEAAAPRPAQSCFPSHTEPSQTGGSTL